MRWYKGLHHIRMQLQTRPRNMEERFIKDMTGELSLSEESQIIGKRASCFNNQYFNPIPGMGPVIILLSMQSSQRTLFDLLVVGFGDGSLLG